MPANDQPYCTCKAGKTGYQQDKYDLALWVHSVCGKPSKGFLESHMKRLIEKLKNAS